MKKFIFIISTVLLFSVAIFAQIEKPIEWKTLAPEVEEFSVDAPENTEFSVFYNNDANNVRDKKDNRRYMGTAGKTYFFIFSDVSAYDPQFKTVMQFVEIKQKEEFEAQKNSKTMSFKFSDDENFFHAVYAVRTKKRSYIFHTVSESKNDPNVERFFKSIKIDKKPANVESMNENRDSAKKSADDKLKTAILPGNGSGTGSGNGQGSGFGIGKGDGSGTGNGIGLPNVENKTDIKALNITFKPKPKYTDFARFYLITGNVRVRVAFLTDAKIGTTTALTRLPFGLTNSAIAAAKEMRFEPQMQNGRPVAVVKVVVFNFTIY